MAYTYLVSFPNLDLYYYGVRYAKNSSPDDLMKTYFTSCKMVKSLVNKGEPFITEIRKEFDCSDSAIKWESKCLTRLKRLPCWSKFINLNIGKAIAIRYCSKGAKIGLKIRWAEATKEDRFEFAKQMREGIIKKYGSHSAMLMIPEFKENCSRGGKAGQKKLKEIGFDFSRIASLSSIDTVWFTDGETNRRVKSSEIKSFIEQNPTFSTGSTKNVVVPDNKGRIYLYSPDGSIKRFVKPDSDVCRDLISLGYYRKGNHS